MDMREFPLTALYGLAVEGYISRLVLVCTLSAQTEGLHF